MTYAFFQKEQKEYLETVTPQERPDSIPHIPEIFYGSDYTVKLLDSDGIQEQLDLSRAAAEIEGRPFDENKEKGRLIREVTGDLTKEAKLEYDKFIPAKDPDTLLKNLGGFYQQMTGQNLTEACETPDGQEKIKALLGRDNLEGVSDIEKAAALTSMQKSYSMLEFQDLRNTNTSANYHIITVENKAANPLGFHMSRIALLPPETQEKLTAHADKLLPVTHDGAAWHEMTHALGTDDESKCEGFRFLKTLKEYQEPVLILPDINARLYNNLCTLETIRKDAREGKKTLNGNFRYIMPKMMKHIIDNADSLTADARNMSDAQVMEKTKEIVKECAYDEKTETAFRDMAKTCDSPQALAQALRDVYKNGPENPQTGTLYPLVNDFIETAHALNPSIPAEDLPARFFAAENFKSQSRNIGKVKIEQQEIILSDDEKKHYQELYDQIKWENPSAEGKKLDVLFAQAVVKDGWRQKASLETEMETPATAKNILFNQDKAAEYSGKINAALLRSRNASGIVKTYGAEFAKGKYRTAQKTGLHRQICQTAQKPAGQSNLAARLKAAQSHQK